MKDSYIRAIITYTGDKCGTLGPRFTIQDKDWNDKDLSREQLADFLNDATGLEGGPRLIDENVERGLLSDFSDDISFKDGRYVYNGPQYSGPSNHFSTNYKEAKIEAEKEVSLLSFANSKVSKGVVGHFASAESYAVLQHEVGITNSFSIKPILGSHSAGPCIIIAIWNSNTKEAVLAHVDALTTFSSVESLFRRVSSNESDNLEVHLHGGDSSTKKQAMEIVELVKSQKNAELVSANLCTGHASKSLAIDSRTGSTFTVFSAKKLEHSSDCEDSRLKTLELQFTETPLSLCLDGRKMIQQVAKLSANSVFSPASTKKKPETYCGLKPGFL
jgi:hypothetical protein